MPFPLTWQSNREFCGPERYGGFRCSHAGLAQSATAATAQLAPQAHLKFAALRKNNTRPPPGGNPQGSFGRRGPGANSTSRRGHLVPECVSDLTCGFKSLSDGLVLPV